ncbi:hypothetical protein BRC79_05300 [Halobacteriales archaeon QH_8_67_27]|nr:MAG: hypothetical protein BRC79_05300 [Halobacteriales archaeon QH_8_67_27]
MSRVGLVVGTVLSWACAAWHSDGRQGWRSSTDSEPRLADVRYREPTNDCPRGATVVVAVDDYAT